ncbi:MAG TPA: hypothetical protein VOA87_19015 [Thermoanaerobaculia bacterium]|nr:hypothetical protein [Thermoanaerobaculia bacterium]
MKRHIALALTALTLALAAPAWASGKMTDCEMAFTLKGWSAFYKVAHGSGTITCDNGQKAKVKLEAKGGGLTAGRSEIREGHGKFSEVADIDELFGTYATGGATAAAGKAASAGVVTKGEVSLALAGKGTGIELGVSFGKFIISKE